LRNELTKSCEQGPLPQFPLKACVHQKLIYNSQRIPLAIPQSISKILWNIYGLYFIYFS